MIYNYRVDVLRNNTKIGELLSSSLNIKFDSTRAVTRALQLTVNADDVRMVKERKKVRDFIFFDGTRYFNNTWCFVSSVYDEEALVFDMFRDRIRPILIKDGTEYSLGNYMIISAPKTINRHGSSYSIEAYDETMILKQSAFTKRTLFTSGTKYINVLNSILTECGFANVNYDDNDAVLLTDREIEPSTTYIDFINTLLDELNYRHIFAGSDGYLYLKRITESNTPNHIYRNGFSITGSIESNTDLYDVPNVLTGIYTNPEDRNTYTYTKVNDDVSSKVSTVSRGYKVVKVYRLSNIASNEELRNYIDRKALEAMQTTETLDISTIPEGGHEYGDYVQIDTPQVRGLYKEVAWSIDFGVNGVMKHTLERKVFL